MVDPIRPLAETLGLVLLAPDSRGGTWDAINGTFLDDVQFIDRAFTHVFSRVRVDASRVRIVGFSDGGSYSLSVGMINGDLFSRVAAFSPGFIIQGPPTGKPKMFITHGTRDGVLPIDQASRLIVPQLRGAGYEVEYFEFDGGHGVTDALFGPGNGVGGCLTRERRRAAGENGRMTAAASRHPLPPPRSPVKRPPRHRQ